jgi:hypothetical protein
MALFASCFGFSATSRRFDVVERVVRMHDGDA